MLVGRALMGLLLLVGGCRGWLTALDVPRTMMVVIRVVR